MHLRTFDVVCKLMCGISLYVHCPGDHCQHTSCVHWLVYVLTIFLVDGQQGACHFGRPGMAAQWCLHGLYASEMFRWCCSDSHHSVMATFCFALGECQVSSWAGQLFPYTQTGKASGSAEPLISALECSLPRITLPPHLQNPLQEREWTRRLF